MTLKSMTGFARADGADEVVAWAWELRSVNGRGLDLRLRTAPGYEALEPQVREMVSKQLSRGSVSVNLSATRRAGSAEIRVNETALEQVLKAAERLQHLTGCERPRAEGLLALRGVLETVEETESEGAVEGRRAAMLKSLEQALQAMLESRASEGRRLAAVLTDQLAEIERLVAVVEVHPARSPETIRKRLAEQVARLMETGSSFDAARLHQEAVLLATRADVEEELKRLRVHIESARELITSRQPAGRKLDFLTQEFNREANTLCSKSSDTDITRAGLALKAVIDQMREQVQNIE